uniref:Dynactin subunit 6 n=1 Tax=Phallusia mammillata TaxID=59560 RepID=A0A6F9DA19_9ASCI|nr:dynactin subunit 6-like [Phallusia mammillata]
MIAQRRSISNPLLDVATDALVCNEATLEGSIKVGARCVIHPKATIIAKDGPIVIGEGNLIEEQTLIINKNRPGDPAENTPLIIGNHNVFEVGSEFQGKSIGNHNIVESKAKVGTCTTLSNGCVIGAACDVNIDEVLPENTVICGDKYLRRINADKPQPQTQQIDFLKKILPNYHHLTTNKNKKTSTS